MGTERYKVTINFDKGSYWEITFETMEDADNFIHDLKFPNTVVTYFPTEIDKTYVKMHEKILIYTNHIVAVTLDKDYGV